MSAPKKHFKCCVLRCSNEHRSHHWKEISRNKSVTSPKCLGINTNALCVNVRSFSSGSQRRRSLSLPVLTLIFPALLPCLVRDSLCTALQTKILWINWSLNAIDTETWVSGNLTALTERSQPAIRWRVGEVANRVSCRLFPWRTLISTYSEP